MKKLVYGGSKKRLNQNFVLNKGKGMNEDTKKLKESRKKLGWSVDEFGKAVGVSGRTIENYEQGRRKIPKTVMLLLNIIEKENQ